MAKPTPFYPGNVPTVLIAGLQIPVARPLTLVAGTDQQGILLDHDAGTFKKGVPVTYPSFCYNIGTDNTSATPGVYLTVEQALKDAGYTEATA